MQYIIIGNYGNHSLAVMQYLIDRDLSALHFIYVETGWASPFWKDRVLACSDYARSRGVIVHTLKAPASFSEMVIDRKQFPSRKFQWCASFIKGLTILAHLDEIDPACEALIISGKRRYDSRRYADLTEFEDNNDLYQGRTLWYPLWQTSNEEFAGLIKKTNLEWLSHPSMECSPCIHSPINVLPHLDSSTLARLEALEQETGQTMFQQPIHQLCVPVSTAKEEKSCLQQFDAGCGAVWGCGE
ncbi:phosphoadenosine phosphosulfate reductase family protein [Legionella fairfieldensis]|uniref:phosphoadenosine phosphosulfate reductase domain-containing protein n=1 Tax=Legionella fairfieldensis TaxID=45064 RepID=UPI00048E5332|nr:phosphoadenosine phosphosulfate reductase family protein [Legionella fairfieldensis]